MLALVPWGVRGLYETPAVECKACPPTMGGELPCAIKHPAVLGSRPDRRLLVLDVNENSLGARGGFVGASNVLSDNVGNDTLENRKYPFRGSGFLELGEAVGDPQEAFVFSEPPRGGTGFSN